MPLHETDAFVLRTYTLKEADKVCLFFTREAGKLRGVAHGARRLRSRYGASLEPFTEVALIYFQKEHKELVSISGSEIISSQFFEGMSSERLGVLHYLAELVIEFIPDHEPNERVYRLITATLEALRGSTQPQLQLLVRYFEIWMLKLAGYFPDWRYCGQCQRELTAVSSVWVTNEGTPQCAACGELFGQELRAAGWRTIQEILTQPPVKFISSSREAHVVSQVGNLATRLIDRVLERELKSYEVLNRLRSVESVAGGE
ncbi:MAG TPA: DNA repair protein RecO [Blastocatellia bacterium]|nr:DNA repair protein RecO [Blastocatellia bacterium]